jgi:hypothetical protein
MKTELPNREINFSKAPVYFPEVPLKASKYLKLASGRLINVNNITFIHPNVNFVEIHFIGNEVIHEQMEIEDFEK